MNNEKNVEKMLKKVVEKMLAVDANRTSCTVIYQPKAPEKLKAFKKAKR